MITPNTMIGRAMRLLQVAGPDVAPTAQELADGLYALNAMLDSWSIERLMVYQIEKTERAWPSLTASRTIGDGGNYDASRPSKVAPLGNFFRSATGVDTALTVIDRTTFDCFRDKTSVGTPEYLAVDHGFPLMTLYAYPVPDESLTLHLNTWVLLPAFATGTDEFLLPAGYQTAIEYNLALELAPEYGAAARAAAAAIAKQASLKKSAIKAINSPSMIATPAYPGGSGYRANILIDQ